ncbi:hypothetical protein FACS189460_1220 [Deltaproteobacteria bacterium]|nr:hypothetical protein FACS189460_1150 [Deltaproteobacteria bacterium]GHV56440.1 hypothetical protein FACS189460_1220 [Deltaproteobacteria bacterium]
MDEVKPMINLDKPKVTVLISTYNRPQYLAEAIDSVSWWAVKITVRAPAANTPPWPPATWA